MKTNKNEFDQFATDYDNILDERINFAGYDSSFFDERKIKEILDFLKLIDLNEKPLKFLNFGCGTGKSEKFIAHYFKQASIYSIDISEKSIEIAKKRNKGLNNLTFTAFDGYNIPVEYGFDVIIVANVLHHISPDEHIPVLNQIYQKMNNNGYLFIFEHNPFNPVTLKVVNSCELDKNAILLKPGYTKRILKSAGFQKQHIRFIHFFPKFLSFLTPFEKLLRKLPIGAQYYFIALKQM